MLIAFGCGGGGGGGGGSTPHLTYSGLTTPAVITEDNAQALSAGALNAGSTGTAFTGVAALTDSYALGQEKGGPFLIDFATTIKNIITQMDPLIAPQNDMSAAIVTVRRSIDGFCGGRAYVEVEVNDQTGDFSGDISFRSYCEDGVTLNGNASFSGSGNTFRMDFNYITGVSGSESVTMDGSIEFSISYSSEVITMNMIVRDNVARRTCMIQDYQMSIIAYDADAYAEITIRGRFYDPDEGYVDIVTDPPFIVYYVDSNPSSGVMTLTGDDGTSVVFTALSNNECQLEADTDGNEIYDITITMDWDEL
jgi:hypothetical protein